MLNMGLGFVFSAQDMASGAIKGLERNFMSLDKKVGLGTDRIQGSFQQLGVGMGLLGAGAVMVGGAFAMASIAGEFETAVAAVGAVSGATAAELEQLKEAAIQAGIATQYSPTEATVGLRELAQAGYNAKESMALLIPTLDLAAGSLGELTPQTAAGLASQALKAFGMSAEDAGPAVDKMLQAVNQFALGAGELPAALGIASRGAQTLKQDLGETLIALGLVKNIIPGVERASTGVAVAMERMADPKTQKALKEIGVSATTSEGKFRPFLDIIGDMIPELNKMTDAKRSAYVIETFGAHALGSMQAIMTQVNNGIRTNTGVTLKGAAAVDYLRNSFANAGGTAAGFRDKMLDTFEGQKKLLKGSMETVAIVMGQPFSQVFKPIVGLVVQAVNGVLGFFKGLPAPVKKAFAAFVVGAGAVLSLVGAFIAAKASFALAGIALKALGLTFGGLMATIAPVVGWLALAATMFYGLKIAAEKNIGGFGDMVSGSVEKAKLAFEAFGQLFTDGGFSGKVMEDLNKTENQGLKGFLVTVFVWVERIRNLFRGIMGGFEAGIALARPAIAAFKEVLESLGNSFGKLFGENDPQKNASSWEKWGAIGQRVGMAFAYIFNLVLKVIVTVLKVVDGIVQGFDWVRLGAEILWDALSQLGTQLQSSINHLFGVSDATGEASTGWETFGKVISWVVGAILSTIGVLVSVISAAFSIISAAIEIVKSVVLSFADIFMGVVSLIDGIITGDWSKIWLGMKQVAFGVVNGIIAVLMELVGAVAGVVDALGSLFGQDFKFQDSVRGFKDFVSNEMQKDMGIENDTVTGVRPVVSRVPVPSGTVDATPAATIASMTPVASGYGAAPAVPAADTGPKGPTVINLQVDGQKLAQVVHSADRDSAGRSFSPVPVY